VRHGEIDLYAAVGNAMRVESTTVQHVNGVISAVSGYAGGSRDTAHYEMTSTGTTGHAESVQITYPASCCFQKRHKLDHGSANALPEEPEADALPE
jgi:hypothetical protein